MDTRVIGVAVLLAFPLFTLAAVESTSTAPFMSALLGASSSTEDLPSSVEASSTDESHPAVDEDKTTLPGSGEVISTEDMLPVEYDTVSSGAQDTASSSSDVALTLAPVATTSASSLFLESKQRKPEPTASTVEEIILLEEAFFAQYGKYLQILSGNVLPEYEKGSVARRLGKAIPKNMRVDVYHSPEGPGFRVVYEGDSMMRSRGYGPLRELLTYEKNTPDHPLSLASEGGVGDTFGLATTTMSSVADAVEISVATSSNDSTPVATSTADTTGTEQDAVDSE